MPPQLATAAAATAAADCLGHCGNIANATVEIKLINTTIGTDHGSGPDPGTEQEQERQQLSTHTVLTTEMAIVNELFFFFCFEIEFGASTQLSACTRLAHCACAAVQQGQGGGPWQGQSILY